LLSSGRTRPFHFGLSMPILGDDPAVSLPHSPVSSPPGDDFLAEFVARKGRPLRVLHIGNIGNNSYNNAKLQRAVGIDADVLCYDYYHVMGCPEWEDASIEGEIEDTFLPTWWKLDLQGFERPRWFVQGAQLTCLEYLLARHRGLPSQRLWQELSVENRTAQPARFVPPVVQRRSRRKFGHFLIHETAIVERAWGFLLRNLPGDRWGRASVRGALLGLTLTFVATVRLVLLPVLTLKRMNRLSKAKKDRLNHLSSSGDSATSSPRKDDDFAPPYLDHRVEQLNGALVGKAEALLPSDLAQFVGNLVLWNQVLSHYDVIQGYSIDGVYPLVLRRPYIAHEHGTLRDLPFEDSPLGRICAAVYALADRVFVTNTDVLPSADRLGIAESRVVKLPHPFNASKPREFVSRHPRSDAPEHSDVEPVPFFVAPARQHWTRSDDSMSKGNDQVFRAVQTLHEEGFEFRVLCIEWGEDLEASKQLIAELGCERFVSWRPPMRKQELWTAYDRCVAVLDQFILPAMGGVTFEALALGKRTISRIDESVLSSFFGQAPPVMNAATADEISGAMRAVLLDPHDEGGIGRASGQWVDNYHSPERTVRLQVSAYEAMLAGPSAPSAASD
jgi:glycosyltransferase involved in cell wall biosynthesis